MRTAAGRGPILFSANPEKGHNAKNPHCLSVVLGGISSFGVFQGR